MSLIDQFFGIHHGSPEEDLMDEAVGRFMLMETKKDLGESILGRLTGDRGESDYDKLLDRTMKKKALGLPWTKEEFQDAEDNDSGFLNHGVLAAFGVKASKMIPDPKLLEPHHGGRLPPNTPELAGELYHSILGGPRGGRSSSIVSSLLRRRT